MGRVWVDAAEVQGDELVSMRVRLAGLPPRTIPRATAIAWLRDGHSFLYSAPHGGFAALQLVSVDGEDGATASFIRTDNASEASDQIPSLSPSL